MFVCPHLQTSSERLFNNSSGCGWLTVSSFSLKHKRHFFVMLGYAGTLLTIDHFKGGFSWCFSFVSHIYLEDLCHLYIVYYGRISHSCDNVSWSLPLLFLNILYLGLLMLKRCICKLCLEIDIDRLGGILIWFYSCMALHGFVVWTVNDGHIFCTGVANFHCISVEYFVQFVRFWEVMVQ